MSQYSILSIFLLTSKIKRKIIVIETLVMCMIKVIHSLIIQICNTTQDEPPSILTTYFQKGQKTLVLLSLAPP